MKKRVISAFLCTVMAVSLLTGCGSDEKKSADNKGSKDGNYEEFITVDVYDEFANYQGVQSGWFAKIVKDKFNMELNIIAPNVAGGGQTLYQTRSAAGELGDLVLVNTSNGKLNDLVSSGLIMDCTDLMDGKDIVENYGEAIDVTNEGLPEEGMFAFPNSVSTDAATESSEGLEPTFGPYIRWDYYKELGYPKMENLDDFLDVLEGMQKLAREKEGSEDIYAISLFKDWDDNMMNNAKQPACMYGYDEVGFVLSKADGTEEQSILDDDSIYMDVLDFFYEANQRGLVDPDSTTQNYDTWSAKYTDGKVLYCPWPWVGQNLYNTAENKAAGKGFMMAPVEDMQIFSYGSCPEGNSTQVIAIGSNAEDPQRMADFIDWLYSPEGISNSAGHAVTLSGPEGLTWEMKDGAPALTEFGKQCLVDGDAQMPEEYGGGTWKDGKPQIALKAISSAEINPDTGHPYDYTLWDSYTELNSNDLIKDWQDHYGVKTAVEYYQDHGQVLVAPGCSYSEPAEDSEIATIRTQINSTVVEYSWKAVFARDEAEFNEYIKQMQDVVNGLGYERILEIDMQKVEDQKAERQKVLQ